MCGICGKLAIAPYADDARGEAGRMLDSLQHRGPDDRGLERIGRLELGAARLSIIDLEGGHQPLCTADGSIWAAQNGEIYNHAVLRDSLAEQGYAFRTRSDTEVLAQLYAARGEAMVEALRGMFALAIWDARRERLLLARDRLGIKPLFYAEHGGALYFASEIKALLAAGLPRRLDPVALHDYLSWDYVPGPRTMFEGIHKLPAAHHLSWSAESGIRIERFWDLPPQAGFDMANGREADPLPEDEDALAADLLKRLDEAVLTSSVSDVPVGAFLSGGLDSSLVTALMARHASGPVRSFSIGFEEASYDELPWARKVARHLGTQHHEAILRPLDGEAMARSMVEAFDEPFADSSAVAAWAVAREAAAQVKVVMSGDGGDEVFGGYEIYRADVLARAYRRLPGLLSDRALPALSRRLPASESKMSWDLKLRRFVEHGRLDPAAAHGAWRIIFTEAQKRQLYAQGFEAAEHDALDRLRAAFAADEGRDALNRMLALDLRGSLVDDMLTKVDRTSMAHSLEVRVPLLDHPLVEWAARLPSRYKVHGPRLSLKHLLKRAAADLLPQDVIHRRKAGFHVPVPGWLKRELRPLVDHQLGETVLRRQGIFDPESVRALVEEDRAGRANHSRNIWGLLIFGLWYDRHIDPT